MNGWITSILNGCGAVGCGGDDTVEGAHDRCAFGGP
jgi:hypothetical protein